MSRRCLLVAPMVSHATIGRVAALGSGAHELYVADISTRPLRHRMDQYPFTLIKGYFDLGVVENDPLYRNAGRYDAAIIDSLRGRGLLAEDARIAARIREVVGPLQPHVIVTYYGSTAMHFARIIRRLFPRIPIVLIHNTLPITLERRGVLQRCLRRPFMNEFVDYNHWLSTLDFLVCASEQMMQFVRRRFEFPDQRMMVLPDYLSQSQHAGVLHSVLPTQACGPRVIFLGAPERWGPTIDNLDTEFLKLTAAGISISSGAISDEVIGTGYGFKYPYFTDDEVFTGKLADYAHSFDAALITYGVEQRRERFRTILPTRFLTALTAAVPIVVKAGMFDAVEAYIEKHALGFVYADTASLKAGLADLDAIATFRHNAIAHLAQIGGERQSQQFESIFDRVIEDAA